MWQLSFSGMGAERPEAKQKRKRRRVGILGIEQESSEDDRDYRPPTSVLRSPSSVPPRQAAADLEADIDLSLAVRRQRLLSAAAQPSASSRQQQPAAGRGKRAKTASSTAAAANAAFSPHPATEATAATSAPQLQAAAATSPSPDWRTLPADVLQLVFSAACRTSALPTACALQCVCTSWRAAAAATPDMWTVLNMSRAAAASDAVIERMCRRANRPWSGVQQVQLGAANLRISEKGLACLAQHCPQLHTLDISGTHHFRASGLQAALAAMPALRCFKTSGAAITPVQGGLDTVLRALLAGQPAQPPPTEASVGGGGSASSSGNGSGSGSPASSSCCRLEALVASSCPALSVQTIRALSPEIALLASRPHLWSLRTLDLTDSGRLCAGIIIRLDRFQLAAPNLQVLRISGLGGAFGWTPSAGAAAAAPAGPAEAQGGSGDAEAAGGLRSGSLIGFPKLVVCEVAACLLMSSTGYRAAYSALDNSVLRRLCGRSHSLEVLDVSGHPRLTAGLFASLPRCPLRVLHLQRCGAATDEALASIASLYGATLEVLDVSFNGAAITDAGLHSLAGSCQLLHKLGLEGTSITDAGLRALLLGPGEGGGLPALRSLQVTGCRGLSRPVRSAAADGVAALRRALA